MQGMAQAVKAQRLRPRRLRVRHPERSSRLYGVAVLLLFLVAWWIAAAWVARTSDRADVLLPSPLDVVRSFRGLAVFAGPGAELTYANAVRVVVENSIDSGRRLLFGLLIGAVVGVGSGLLLGWNWRLRNIAEGPLLAIRVIPLLALLPLFLAWYGGREAGNITFIAFAVFTMLFVNTLEAIRNVDPVVQNYARTLGASSFRVYRTVVVPAIIPELVGGIRVVLGLAWAILLAAEFLASQSGIGHILILAQQYSYTSRMILIVLLIMFYTYVIDQMFAAGAAYLTRWVPR
jgi:sulfonate transport system permease protein